MADTCQANNAKANQHDVPAPQQHSNNSRKRKMKDGRFGFSYASVAIHSLGRYTYSYSGATAHVLLHLNTVD